MNTLTCDICQTEVVIRVDVEQLFHNQKTDNMFKVTMKICVLCLHKVTSEELQKTENIKRGDDNG